MESNLPAPDGQTPVEPTPSGQTPQPVPQGQTPQTHRTSIDTLPVDIQEYIKSLRADAKKLRSEKETQERANQEAEEARLKQQGEYKTLAEKHEARVRELEPVASRYQSLSELVNTQIDAQIKDWPPELKTFDPGKRAPIEDRMAWVNKSLPLLERLQHQARTMAPGNSPAPQPSSGPPDRDVQELRDRYRATGRYGI